MDLKIWEIENMSKNTNTWILYRHTSPSGRVYIGISKNAPIVRWGRDGSGYKHNQLFRRATDKYGWDNIKHEVLFTDLSEQKAKQLEIDLIRHYKQLGISYNITDGGEGTVGWCPSEKLRSKWSEQRKGRTITEEWRKHISEAGKGRKMPEGHGKKLGQIARERDSIAIVQLTMDGVFIQSFYSIRDAGRYFGNAKNTSDIISCCKGKALSAKGFIWLYKTDYDSYVKEGTLNNYVANIHNKINSGYKYHKPEEWRKKLSEIRKGKNYNTPEHMHKMKEKSLEVCKKCVMQLSVEGVPVSVFRSAVEIKEKTGFGKSSISCCCNGKNKTAYGYKWQFITKEEYEEYKRILDAA